MLRMRNLLQDADRDRLAAPLKAAAADLAIGGLVHRALPETPGSAFFPAAANAHVAELLLLPGLYERYATLTDTLLDFLMALAEAPVPAGQAFAGTAELLRDDPADLLIRTPHFRFTGDLRRGVLRQEAREPGAGGPVALRHTGNLVEFRIGRHAACVDVEDTITDAAITSEGEVIVLTHTSTIRGKAGLFTPREVEAGRLVCRYEIHPHSPVLQVEMRFTATTGLTDLRLTTALDALDEDGPGATAARLLAGGIWQEADPPSAPGPFRWLRDTSLAHVAVGATGWPAGRLAAHLRPHTPSQVLSATAEAKRGGAVHWLVLRHGPETLRAGQSFVVREERLLAPGDPTAVATMMAGKLLPGLDLDVRSPAGPALQAAGAALLLDAARDQVHRLPVARRVGLAEFADRQMGILAASAAVADRAQTLICADALRRAGLADGTVSLQGITASLARALAAPCGLADRALAVLALARAATWPEAEAAPPTLQAVLARFEAGGAAAAPTLRLDGETLDPLVEAEGIALLARAAGAVVLAAEAGAPLDAACLGKARDLHRTGIALLRPMVRPRDGMLEVQGPQGPASGLQALVALALLAPDRLVLKPAASA